MSILNPDLINSCRVCRSPNQDGDYECLYKLSSQQEEASELSDAGILYESLLNIPLKEQQYPQFLCNSCDLQMKLFKKLRDKAYKTLEYLQNLYEQVGLKDVEENVEQICQGYIDGCQENEFQESKENVINNYQTNDDGFDQNIQSAHREEALNEFHHNAFNVYQHYSGKVYQKMSENEYQEYTADEYEKNNLTALNLHNEELNSEESEALNTTANDIETNKIQEAGINVDYLNKCKIKIESIEGSKESSLTSNELDQYIDKNDYVTEIYELLDDEDNIDDAYSETNESIEFDVFAEEEAEASSAWSDMEYVVEEIYNESDESNTEINANAVKKICETNATARKRKYKCAPCQLEFNNSKEQKIHRTEVHNSKHVCSVCLKEFKSLPSLHHHMKVHSDQPAFQCEICLKTFNQKAHYQYHMNHHNNVRNFKCNLCEKAFLSRTDLKVHLRFHSGQRPYVCKICGKDYLMTEHLKTHLLTHTDQYFQCEICNRKFATHKTLRLHVRTIHEDEPKFKCSFCSKPFRRKHHLQYHLKVHEKNEGYIDNNYEMVDDPGVDDTNCNSNFVEEQHSIQDPGFIALDDDVI